MTLQITKTNKLKYHTDLKAIIVPFAEELKAYNWLLTNQDYILLDFDTKGVVEKLNFDVDRIEFKGEELFEIILNREIQFVWGVFCAFKTPIPIMNSSNLPYADCNSLIWTNPDSFFFNNSEIEIICFDGTSTLIRFRDKSLEQKFKNYFGEASELKKV